MDDFPATPSSPATEDPNASPNASPNAQLNTPSLGHGTASNPNVSAERSSKKRKKVAKTKTTASKTRRLQTVSVVTNDFRKPSWRLTPWIDWHEWLQMKTLLTTNNHVAARKLLTIFTMRRRSNVPVAMTTSVALVSHLNHTDASDAYSRRLSLAMAITRFVNGMTDLLQPHDIERRAISVASIGKRLNLPPLLVEIRHQASHNQLPALSTLEEGARQALLWLDAYYWNAQLTNLQNLNLLRNVDVQRLKHTFEHVSYSKLRTKHQVKGRSRSSVRPKLREFTTFDPNQDFGEATLQRMQEQIRQWGLPEKSQLPSKMIQSRHVDNLRDGGIWTECGNNKEWRKTPIGLIPGQKDVPRISNASLGGSESVVNTVEEEGLDRDDDSDYSFEEESSACESDGEDVVAGKAASAERQDQSTDSEGPPLKKLRKFDEDLEGKIAEAKAKFEHLFKSDGSLM